MSGRRRRRPVRAEAEIDGDVLAHGVHSDQVDATGYDSPARPLRNTDAEPSDRARAPQGPGPAHPGSVCATAASRSGPSLPPVPAAASVVALREAARLPWGTAADEPGHPPCPYVRITVYMRLIPNIETESSYVGMDQMRRYRSRTSQEAQTWRGN